MSTNIRNAVFIMIALFLGSWTTSHAAMVMGEGETYDVIAITDTFFNLSSELTAQPWWGNSSLASELAINLGDQLGLPNDGGLGGPGFARLQDSLGVYANYWFPSGPSVQTRTLSPFDEYTFAIVNPVPLPSALVLLALPLVALARRRRPG